MKKIPEIEAVHKEMKKDFDSSKLSHTELKSKYLGKKGEIMGLLKNIKAQDPEIRPAYGQKVNDLKKLAEERLALLSKQSRRQAVGKSMSEEEIDLTAPFAPNTSEEKRPKLTPDSGALHPITSVGEKALRIFESMGFHVTEARRLDSDYNVFESLNFPKGHPARDMFDTFWTDSDLIPITHTSSMQNRIISGKKPPIREVIVGKCFRNESTDASHEHTFYQVEGVYVDEGISLADLVGTLSEFMNAFYGKDIKYTIQPSYFPFVEPGLEFLIECLVCGQKGCPFCSYSGWIELVPCGPIHPNVITDAGLDAKKYSGFAWGLGLDRLVILRNQISDIRHFHDGDLNFLEQFK